MYVQLTHIDASGGATPTKRRQFVEPIVRVRKQSLQHVLEIDPRFVPVVVGSNSASCPLPGTGDIPEIAALVVELLAPYFDLNN